MVSHHAATMVRQDLVRLCHSGLDSLGLRAQAIHRLRRTLPIDSFWFATADPATLLPTGSLVEAIPEQATPLFLANEFSQDDVNKFTQLAVARLPVNSLYHATRGHLEQSPRYRDILMPLGFGDELRAALSTGGSCWGFMCLHRELKGSSFSPVEADLLATIVSISHMGCEPRFCSIEPKAGTTSMDPDCSCWRTIFLWWLRRPRATDGWRRLPIIRSDKVCRRWCMRRLRG